jgi:hypothetical protein
MVVRWLTPFRWLHDRLHDEERKFWTDGKTVYSEPLASGYTIYSDPEADPKNTYTSQSRRVPNRGQWDGV